uniref:E3 ubiquitin-protein ligase n=1 Tax=Romanomermis culicivorax TaxID=13658 RepID=A0A915K565_ROMCU
MCLLLLFGLGVSATMGSRWDSLLVALQKYEDTSAQLQGLIELCNQLVMSNEESVGSNFPVKDMIRCLIKLLQVEHNFDIMTHACRALTYLMEALPRVTIHVTDAIPYLLEKLQRVECIDVAEQSLAALELLSRRHGKNILNADKKTVEILCQAFTRLVDNYVNDPEKLERLSDYGLLDNIQQLIVMSPPLLNCTTLCSVIRMIQILCRQCNDIAVKLLRMNILASLCILLIGTVDPLSNSELLARSSHELHELVLFIGELWPALPNDGLFEVDSWLKSSVMSNEHILWTWRDDKGLWRPFSHVDNRILETAYQSKEEEVSISVTGQTFTIDLLNMLQVNEETGHSQPIQRRVATAASPSAKKSSSKHPANLQKAVDARLELLQNEPKLYDDFFRSTFSILYEIYTTGNSKEFIFVHSLIAGILNSQDLKSIVPALQLSRVLIEKQREIFTVHFKREGVTHQLHKLSVGNVQFNAATSASSSLPLVSGSHTLLPSTSFIVVTNSTGSSSNVGYQQHQYIPSSSAMGLSSHQIMPTSSTVYSNHDLSNQPATAPTSVQTPGVISKRSMQSMTTEATLTSKTTHGSSKKRGVMSSSSTATSSSHSKHCVSSEKSLKNRNRAVSENSLLHIDRMIFRVPEKLSDEVIRILSGTSKSASSSSATGQQSLPSQNFDQPIPTTATSASASFLSTSFLSNLSLPRWAKPASYGRQHVSASKTTTNSQALQISPVTSTSSASSMAQAVASNSFNMLKATSWVKQQGTLSYDTLRINRMIMVLCLIIAVFFAATSLLGSYFSTGEGQASTEKEGMLLTRLSNVSTALRKGDTDCLAEFSTVLSSDVSCFEILQSNIVPSLLEYITKESVESNIDAEERIRQLCQTMFRIKLEADKDGIPTAIYSNDQSLARNFVQKLNTCVSQLELLPVKVHDFAFGQSGGALRGLNALRFLHTQQIKCLLQRHPEDRLLRQWRRGPIKVDPLAQISTIERYLVTRGFARTKSSSSNEEICSEDDNDSSGEDSDETTVRQGNSESSDGMHRLQLSISDKILPADLSVYQAIRQFGTRFSDHVDWLGPEIWVNTHTIFYRLAPETRSDANSALSDPKSTSKSSSSTKNRAKDKAHLKPVLDPKGEHLPIR